MGRDRDIRREDGLGARVAGALDTHLSSCSPGAHGLSVPAIYRVIVRKCWVADDGTHTNLRQCAMNLKPGPPEKEWVPAGPLS